jgi:hypothetical protein
MRQRQLSGTILNILIFSKFHNKAQIVVFIDLVILLCTYSIHDGYIALCFTKAPVPPSLTVNDAVLLRQFSFSLAGYGDG